MEIIWTEHTEPCWHLDTTVSKGDKTIQVWIEKRPVYCDRGHYSVNATGNLEASIDWQDGFPRYFMDLSVAKQETEAWLRWRLKV
jgi:hypothetical protein